MSDSKNARGAMEDLTKFYRLVSGFSSALINIPPDALENKLGNWLKRFVDFLNIDRMAISLLSEDKSHLVRLQYYCAPGSNAPSPPPIIEMQPSPEYVLDRLSRGQALIVDHIKDDLTAGEQEMPVIKVGFRSFVSVPLAAKNKVLGIVAFSLFQRERQWPDELITGFELIGVIIANALLRRQSQQSLQAEVERRKLLEQRYATAMKTTNVGFWISDMNQTVLEVNEAACAITGYSREEMISRKVTDFDVMNSYQKIQEIRHTLKTEGSVSHLARHRRKDGAIVDLAVSSTFLEEEGKIFAFFSDSTELLRIRAELEEQLRFEELITDFSAALIDISHKDLEHVLDIWMARLARHLNVDRCTTTEYLEGLKTRRHLQVYINPDHADTDNVVRGEQPAVGLHKLVEGRNYLKLNHIPEDIPKETEPSFRDRLLHDGTKSLFLMPIKSRKSMLGIVLFASYTHENIWTDSLVQRIVLVAEIIAIALLKRRGESELSQYREHLEQLVQDRTAQLEEARDELVRSERLATLGKVAATVSHELRNPLGTIRSSLYALRLRCDDSDPIIQTAIVRAEGEVLRCDLIIDELLNFTRFAQLDLKDTPIDSWLEELLSSEASPPDIEVKKDLSANLSIRIDQERFRRCMINLLTNAYEAQENRDGARTLSRVLVSTAVKQGMLEITVADNGIGFDPAETEKLYEPLYGTKRNGVGLGLSVAKQIIEQHGGRLTLNAIQDRHTPRLTTAQILLPITKDEV